MDLITVERFDFRENETFSKVYILEKFECFGLEDELREIKVHGETAIGYDRYNLGLHDSARFSDKFYYSVRTNRLIKKSDYLKMSKKGDFSPHMLIHVQNVKDFDWILIHPLNTELETDGCLGVGKSIGKLSGKPAILDSISAYIQFYCKVFPSIKKGILSNKPETILYKK
jgi:hypothetical protein